MVNPQSKLGFKIDPIKGTDLRDNLYQAKAAIPRKIEPLPFKFWSPFGKAFDQGETSSCVGHAWVKLLRAADVHNLQLNEEHAFHLYKRAQEIDEWPGEEPEYYGTSIRAGAKVLQNDGFIGEYFWAEDIQTAINWLSLNGPCIFGTIFTYSMFSTTNGFVNFKLDDNIAGGHAYCVIGFNRNILCPDGTRGGFRFINSWGDWDSYLGRAWLPFSVAEILLKENGEICCPTEIKK